MGYTTEFYGELEFNMEPNTGALKVMDSLLGKDLRDVPEVDSGQLTWMGLEYSCSRNVISWDGSEKTYDMPEKVALLIRELQKVQPELHLNGEFETRGEYLDDIWFMRVNALTVEKLEGIVKPGASLDVITI